MNIARSGRLNTLAIAGVVLAILIVTLAPTKSGPASPFSFAFVMGRRGLSDAILNLLLFFPLGMAIAWNGRSVVAAGMYGLLLAAVIEAAQTVLPGRDPALSDIVLNTAGALAGAVIGRHWDTLLNPDAKQYAILTTASLILVASIMIATAVLLAPLAESPLRAARQLQLPESPSDGAKDVRTLLSLEVPTALEPIVIARSGDDLLLRYPSTGAALGFDEPEYWSVGKFVEDSSGKATRVSVTRDRSRWYVGIGTDRLTLGPTLGDGWATLAYPNAIGRKWGRFVSPVWLLAMFFPVGFWARGRARLGAGAAGVTLLAVVPLLTGLAATRPLEWCGALAGFVVGAALGDWVARRSQGETVSLHSTKGASARGRSG